ncbi:hypothetical protein QC761_0066270 [Podospora bellae-mahoneyi]|uniref:Uncharacterized protein n=1 Tax=Podospora bellae-mahoneyi TaxID=2093777 RepID=A0ABR0FK81_9PEZI|nr:hypothetical protein QC761_0066270 [Podospora bellae-mahoneyi]
MIRRGPLRASLAQHHSLKRMTAFSSEPPIVIAKLFAPRTRGSPQQASVSCTDKDIHDHDRVTSTRRPPQNLRQKVRPLSCDVLLLYTLPRFPGKHHVFPVTYARLFSLRPTEAPRDIQALSRYHPNVRHHFPISVIRERLCILSNH